MEWARAVQQVEAINEALNHCVGSRSYLFDKCKKYVQGDIDVTDEEAEEICTAAGWIKGYEEARKARNEELWKYRFNSG